MEMVDGYRDEGQRILSQRKHRRGGYSIVPKQVSHIVIN